MAHIGVSNRLTGRRPVVHTLDMTAHLIAYLLAAGFPLVGIRAARIAWIAARRNDSIGA